MSTDLAIDGGVPIRKKRIPYSRHSVSEEDVAAVVDVLRSDWLTTGPMVQRFEEEFARFVGARDAVVVSSGTAALHAVMHVLALGPGDEVLVPSMTFAASANCVRFVGANPVFVDVDPGNLLIDPLDAEAKITPRTRAILAVDYAGHPCNYEVLEKLASKKNLVLLSDACHSLGAKFRGRNVGTLATMNAFSFHPVKPITTGEGGVITTDDQDLARGLRRFRNHGIDLDHRQREIKGSWFYDMKELGYNYRLSDIQCALGLSQLNRISEFTRRRQEIANYYDDNLSQFNWLKPLKKIDDVCHAYHLYIVRLDLSCLRVDRTKVFRALVSEGIGVNVHYRPLHLHSYYREHLGTGDGMCPVAEKAYDEILSLPIHPNMMDEDVSDVLKALNKISNTYARSVQTSSPDHTL